MTEHLLAEFEPARSILVFSASLSILFGGFLLMLLAASVADHWRQIVAWFRESLRCVGSALWSAIAGDDSHA